MAWDLGNLEEAVRISEKGGADQVHLDVIDGHFAPNITFGPGTVKALRKMTSLKFDTHLMLDEPHRYVESFARAGADLISVHIEPAYDHAGTLARIRSLGCKAGIVLNPGTPADAIEPVLASVDLVLVMTVQPGFGGQAFRRDVLPKLAKIASWRGERRLGFHLEVDGGIDLATAAECRAAGADTFVVGTSFFKSEDPAAFARAFAKI